jgi:hypothetical protein
MWKKCANKTCKETHKQNVLRDAQQIEHDERVGNRRDKHVQTQMKFFHKAKCRRN